MVKKVQRRVRRPWGELLAGRLLVLWGGAFYIYSAPTAFSNHPIDYGIRPDFQCFLISAILSGVGGALSLMRQRWQAPIVLIAAAIVLLPAEIKGCLFLKRILPHLLHPHSGALQFSAEYYSAILYGALIPVVCPLGLALALLFLARWLSRP